MKFIHLSDLHLGKRVNEFSMLEDQEYILRQIGGIIEAEEPRAVLIAGDVYDKSVPSAEAVKLFDAFLTQLSQRGIETLVISGNHDSAERIAFGGRLMERSGVHVSPLYEGHVEPVTLTDEWGEVHFYLLPYFKPAQVRGFFGGEIDGYTAAVGAAVDEMGVDGRVRNVLLAHHFVTGGAASGSEQLSVGGTDNVDAAVFEPFDYVALGHLHGAQRVGRESVRYAGSPLKYSLSEWRQRKSVTVVELGEKGSEPCIRTAPLTPLRDMHVLRGDFAALTGEGCVPTEDYLHIILTDEEDVPEAVGRLRLLYPNVMKLDYDNTRTRSARELGSAEDVERKSELELFEEFYENRNGETMSAEQRDFVRTLLERIREEEK